jgi:hypothetical protein
MSGRRLARAVLALALVAMPAMAAAQSQCRAIRALTNADGRGFADLSIGVARNPLRVTVRIGREEALPTPESCDLDVDPDDVDLTCYWRPGDYSATNALFDTLIARLQQCLDGRLTPPSGPTSYGSTTWLRRSSTDLRTEGGVTQIDLSLIETPDAVHSPAHHYISLSVSYDVEPPPDDAGDG